MDYDKNVCPVVDVDGVIASGKQFDLEIRLPEDNRNVIYGIVKDCYDDPVRDAVVKLVEVICDCGKEKRRPVSHTFTDKEGEFVFGPLCANKVYAIQIWVDNVRHCKICTECKHEGKCLKGVKIDCKHDEKWDCKHDDKYDDECDKKCDDKYDDKWDCKHDDKYDDKYDKKCDDKYNKKCDEKYDDKHEDKCKCKCDCKCDCKHNDKHDDKHDDKCDCKCGRPCLRTEIMS